MSTVPGDTSTVCTGQGPVTETSEVLTRLVHSPS